VGKTRLVDQACSDAEARGFTVLWGRCIRFGAASSSYHPIISALERWLATSSEKDKEWLVSEVAGLEDLLPSLGGRSIDAGGRLLSVIDTAVDKIAGRHPTILVIDDLQWADVTSLDVLAYLITGFRGQRLVLLTTYRDEGLGDGHRLHGWLADMLRAEVVTELALKRMTSYETEQQINLLTGVTPSRGLLADVMAKSHGNSYLTELLVRGVPPDAQQLPPGLPDALRSALLAAWHGLSEQTRQVVRLLAVGGRPLVFADVERVLAAQGIDDRSAAKALSEAIKAGVIRTDSSGEFWFRHPLLAEVLVDTLLPGEEKPLHALFVDALSSGRARGGKLRADLALHCDRADRFDEAFGHYLAVAAAAQRVQGYPEQMAALLRAAELWDRVSPEARAAAGAGSAARLWSDVAFAARSASDADQAFAAIERARELVDEECEPIVASRVHHLWGEIATFAGRIAEQPLQAFRRAVGLAADFPDSVEYARALAALSEAQFWSGDRDSASHNADAAVAAAERNGELQTRSLALQARSMAHINEPSGVEDAEAAYRLALESGDGGQIAIACITRGNYYEEQGRLREAADLYQQSVHGSAGGKAGVEMFHAAYAAYYLVMLGELQAAREMLREPLASRTVGSAGLQARQIAIQVSLRQGRWEDADRHLLRAREIAPDFERHTGTHGAGAYAEYLIATGRPRQALDLLLDQMAPHGKSEPRYADVLLTYGASAAADLADTARGVRDDEGARIAGELLDRLVGIRRLVPREPFERYDGHDLVQPAVQAFFEAERARCLGVGDRLADLWLEAARACAVAEMRWHEALAWQRYARALIADRAGRTLIGLALRASHVIAVRIGAEPVRLSVEAMAVSSRISLTPPVVPRLDAPVNGLSRLTRRELEVLGHLVAGRSYTEIAGSLFISDKTVSVHVSNLLRKTGTKSRVEAAEFARRHGLGAAQ
jgi:DNA-binding CsgD family transcriptional regulator/tetratricopeptide (TPR) repeat protein